MSHYRWFALLLIPFLLFAVNRLGSRRLLGCHHFRQAHTALAAHNYAAYDANLFRPTIDGVTYGKDLYLNEFPLYPYLVGMLWRAFGEHLVIARLLSIVFMVMALWYYHRLLGRLFQDAAVVRLAVLIMSATPVVSYFGRCIERQSLFLAALLAGINWLLVYLDERRRLVLLPATGALALAILLNPFCVYMIVPLSWYAFRQRGAAVWRDWRLYPAALLAVGPALAWYAYVALASRTLATGEIVAIHDHRDFLSLAHYAMWLEPHYWGQMFATLTRYVIPTVPAWVVCFCSVVKAPREVGFGFFRAWLAAVMAYFLVDFYPVAVVIHHYYFINLVPVVSLFLAWGVVHGVRLGGGAAVRILGRDGAAWVLRVEPLSATGDWLRVGLLVLAIAGFAVGSFLYNREMHRDDWHRDYYLVRDQITQHVPEGQRTAVVAESDDPLLSYLLADRIPHRLIRHTPDRMDSLLKSGDFDFLAIVWDTPEFPVEEVVQAVETSGQAAAPLLRRRNLVVYPRRATSVACSHGGSRQ